MQTKDYDFKIYKISVFVLLITILTLFPTYLIIKKLDFDFLFVCSFKTAFGIPCPGCGGTRAIICMLQGNFLKSIYYHPFVLYATLMYLTFFTSHTFALLCRKFFKKDVYGIHFRSCYLIIGVIILLLQYILKLCIPGYLI